MKTKILILLLLILTSCAPASPVVPVETLTPTVMSANALTPTPSIYTRPIRDDEKEKAYDFFYAMKNRMAVGKFEEFAEHIHYPITVQVDGQPTTYIYVAGFEHDFKKIFNPEQINTFISTDEYQLVFAENGIKTPDGLVEFNMICTDATCNVADFLITDINN